MAFTRSPFILPTNCPIDTLNSSVLQARYTQVALQCKWKRKQNEYKLDDARCGSQWFWLTKFPSDDNPWLNCANRTAWSSGMLCRPHTWASMAQIAGKIPLNCIHSCVAVSVPLRMTKRMPDAVLPADWMIQFTILNKCKAKW